MAAYTYKLVRDLLPKHITDAIPDYIGDANYDGDQWIAAAEYIIELEDKVKDLERKLKHKQRTGN